MRKITPNGLLKIIESLMQDYPSVSLIGRYSLPHNMPLPALNPCQILFVFMQKDEKRGASAEM